MIMLSKLYPGYEILVQGKDDIIIKKGTHLIKLENPEARFIIDLPHFSLKSKE